MEQPNKDEIEKEIKKIEDDLAFQEVLLMPVKEEARMCINNLDNTELLELTKIIDLETNQNNAILYICEVFGVVPSFQEFCNLITQDSFIDSCKNFKNIAILLSEKENSYFLYDQNSFFKQFNSPFKTNPSGNYLLKLALNIYYLSMYYYKSYSDNFKRLAELKSKL